MTPRERLEWLESQFRQQLAACAPDQRELWNRHIEAVRAGIDALKFRTDAVRWRSLLESQRIRVIGTAKLGTPEGHITLDFWGRHPDVDADVQASAVRRLIEYVDGLR
jgi:hypothetical protein